MSCIIMMWLDVTKFKLYSINIAHLWSQRKYNLKGWETFKITSGAYSNLHTIWRGNNRRIETWSAVMEYRGSIMEGWNPWMGCRWPAYSGYELMKPSTDKVDSLDSPTKVAAATRIDDIEDLDWNPTDNPVASSGDNKNPVIAGLVAAACNNMHPSPHATTNKNREPSPDSSTSGGHEEVFTSTYRINRYSTSKRKRKNFRLNIRSNTHEVNTKG